MFFWRNDKKLFEHVRRRLKSARAAVFAEFCFIAPVLVMLVSGMIEIAQFYDARVMANHTAWTIGRQATVHMDDLVKTNGTGVVTGYNSQFTENAKNSWTNSIFKALGEKITELKNLKDPGKVTTIMMMSTCGIGYFGGTPGTDTADFLKAILVEPIKEMTKKIKEALKEKASSIVPSSGTGSDFLQQIVNKILDWVTTNIIDKIADKVTDAISKKIDEITKGIDDDVAGRGAWRRRFREVYGAARRTMKSKKNVYTISHLGLADWSDSKISSDERQKRWDERELWLIDSDHQPLDFPAAFSHDSKVKNYNISGYHQWPPKSEKMGFLRVDINWPFEEGWLFPIVSGFRTSGTNDVVYATGSSLAFPQPMIDNDNLRSEGAKQYPYDEKGDDLAKALEEIAKEARQYLRAMIFALDYRLRTETMTHRKHDPDSFWYSAHSDHFYPEMAYCWFDQEKIDENEDGTSEPWGKPGTTQRNTIRDDSLGYYLSWKKVCDEDVWCKESTATKPLKNHQHRNRTWGDGDHRWFYWHNTNDSGKYRSRYFAGVSNSGDCGFSLFNILVRSQFNKDSHTWSSCMDRMVQFRSRLTTYRNELQGCLDGTCSGSTGGPASIINFNDAKDLDLSDTNAVKQYFQKKWNELKTKCESAYKSLDEKVESHWAQSEYVYTNFGNKKKKSDVQSNINQVYNGFDNLLQLEASLCGLLGSPSAKGDQGLDFDDVMKKETGKVDDGSDPNPFAPGNDTGSAIDPDKWTWSKEKGWQ